MLWMPARCWSSVLLPPSSVSTLPAESKISGPTEPVSESVNHQIVGQLS